MLINKGDFEITGEKSMENLESSNLVDICTIALLTLKKSKK